jgi:hypothetical protein
MSPTVASTGWIIAHSGAVCAASEEWLYVNGVIPAS